MFSKYNIEHENYTTEVTVLGRHGLFRKCIESGLLSSNLILKVTDLGTKLFNLRGPAVCQDEDSIPSHELATHGSTRSVNMLAY